MYPSVNPGSIRIRTRKLHHFSYTYETHTHLLWPLDIVRVAVTSLSVLGKNIRLIVEPPELFTSLEHCSTFFRRTSINRMKGSWAAAVRGMTTDWVLEHNSRIVRLRKVGETVTYCGDICRLQFRLHQ